MTKIVLVATSASELSGHPTGLWLEELASPYYTFLNSGCKAEDVIIASPNGGPVPIDEGSLGDYFFTDPAKKFMHDAIAIGKLSHSVPIGDIDFGEDVSAIFLAGGHGTCTDFVSCPPLQKAIETLYASDKVVAAVCHGPMGLSGCIRTDDGKPLVEGKIVTAFSNAEEEAVQKTSLVPFLLEDKMKSLGATYESGDMWTSKVCVDGKLVTGQNPQSSEECAKAVVKLLQNDA